jgi:hypothetical protein
VETVARELLDFALLDRGLDPADVMDACAGIAGTMGVLRAIANNRNPAEELGRVAKVLMSHGHARWQAERGVVVAGRC